MVVHEGKFFTRNSTSLDTKIQASVCRDFETDRDISAIFFLLFLIHFQVQESNFSRAARAYQSKNIFQELLLLVCLLAPQLCILKMFYFYQRAHTHTNCRALDVMAVLLNESRLNSSGEKSVHSGNLQPTRY